MFKSAQEIRLSIGIMAYNEERRIKATLQSLAMQSIFQRPPGETYALIEIVVVPNGCKDNTATVSAEVLSSLFSGMTGRGVSFRVVELAESGKSNAWNRYVHEMVSDDIDFCLFIDADIEFCHPDTIKNSVDLLVQESSAYAVVDKPLKHFLKKSRLGPLEYISAKLSSQNLHESGPAPIAGSFYVARAQVLKQIWLPPGLSGEDGFLRGLMVTDLFRSDVVAERVIRSPNAAHYYEGLTSLRQIFKHEVRMIIGTTLNGYFLWDFLLFCVDRRGTGAGELIRSKLADDPDWYKKYLQNQIRSRGWWKLPKGMLFRRFTGLKSRRGMDFIVHFGVAAAAFLVDVPALLRANYLLSSAKAFGYW